MNNHHFKALASEYRRDLLETLQTESPHHLDTQLDEVSERAVSLVHVHLPLLEDTGLIEWNRDAHVVARGPDFDELETIGEYLTRASTETD